MNPDGSPNLASGATPKTELQLARTDASDLRFKKSASVWGIYRGGVSIFPDSLAPDSVVAIEYGREWTVADFPLEKGAFSSYDKVAHPFDVRLRLTKGGSETTRSAFLAAMENIGASLDLVDVVTPVRTYLDVTITRIGYRQTAHNGVGLASVDVGLREIRQTASAAMSSNTVRDPSSASPVNVGTVRPVDATTLVAAKVTKALAPAASAGAPGG